MYQQKDRGFNCINKYKLRKLLKQGSLTLYLATTIKEEKYTEYKLNMWKTSFLDFWMDCLDPYSQPSLRLLILS